MGLSEACEVMSVEINETYDIGHGDAKDMFEMIWATMTMDVQDKKLLDEINLVAEQLGIS